MSMETRAIEFVRKNPGATQKDIALGTGMHLSGVTKVMRLLYEQGKVTINRRPGMSMKYSLTENAFLLRMPNGDPLYRLFTPDYDGKNIVEILHDLHVALTTALFVNEGAARERYQEALNVTVIPALKRLSLLSEILRDATPEQVKETLEAYERNANEGNP